MKIPHLLHEPRGRAILSIAFVAILAFALLSPLVLGRDARHLGAFAGGREDLSQLRAELESVGGVHAILATPHLLDDVEEPDKTLLVIVGTERRYDASEADAVVRFLERGGRVLLADESGFGTDIARAAGLAFASQPVLDTRNYRGDERLVVASARVGTLSHRVIFNAPTAIIPLQDAAPHEVLATSSPAAYPDGSYLDVNGNGEVDRADQPGPFPLVVKTRVGAGEMILVSDTGAFMNAQLGLADYENVQYARALAADLLPAGGTVLVDESRHAPHFGVAAWQWGVRTLGRLTEGPLVRLATITVLAAAAVLAWRLTRQTEDWSHHEHALGDLTDVPTDVRPDAERLQRMARRRISERFNMPMEQVSAMTTEELLAVCGDRMLADAASGVARGDLASLFRAFSTPRSDAHTEASP